MEEQLKLIRLINEIDKIAVDEYFMDDLMYEDNSIVLDDFSDMLTEIFKDGLNKNILEMILKLDSKAIFKVTNNVKYKNNEIRKEIEKYIDSNESLYLDYDLIKQNISENYKLASYVKDKEKMLDLLELNEKVFLLIDAKYATKKLILEAMKKSDFVSLIFLGEFGEGSQIYRYSDFYRDEEEINDLLYDQLKDILIEDCKLYIRASNLVKLNKKISELVVSIDPRMKAYVRTDL